MRRVVVAAQSFLVFSCFPYVILTSYDFGISGSSHQRCSVKKGVLRHLAKFTGKHLCSSIFFNKVAGLRSATLLKKGLWRRCFPVNFAKLLRAPFLQNTSGRLLLRIFSVPWAFANRTLSLKIYIVINLNITQKEMNFLHSCLDNVFLLNEIVHILFEYGNIWCSDNFPRGKLAPG